MNGQATPLCSICWETLGKYGGPVTLPCGHNGCLHCMAQLQRAKAECPLCRAAFPAETPLVVNHELRDLIALAAALGTVEQNDGWQAITSQVPKKGADGEPEGTQTENGVSLVPTAPPAHMSLSAVLDGDGDMLSLEPPCWVPDSHASTCTRCKAGFRPLARMRHHCQICGGIYCALPRRHSESGGAAGGARCDGRERTAVSGSTPRWPPAWQLSCTRPPTLCGALQQLAAARQTKQYRLPYWTAQLALPSSLLQRAAAAGAWRPARGWWWRARPGGPGPPPPRSAFTAAAGGSSSAGLSPTSSSSCATTAVAAFCGTLHCGLAGGVNLAVGPLGRQAEVTMQVGLGGAAMCYSYSFSRGAFAGVSVDGSLLTTRSDVNLNFYGRPLSAKQFLMGDNVSAPVAADALYTALDDLMARAGALSAERRERLETGRRQQAAAAAVQLTSCMTAALGALPELAARSRSRAALWAARSGDERPAFPLERRETAPRGPRFILRDTPIGQPLSGSTNLQTKRKRKPMMTTWASQVSSLTEGAPHLPCVQGPSEP
ncbi:hypothetical protein WJX75_001366 [Coccomyxa subellipsoidea]|uniref:RING-type domain-containing protein n=1 Tax=Coccomyxa subellipsoidea TaxID=248742 RepID=A0ABR2Z1Z0_9CHLO